MTDPHVPPAPGGAPPLDCHAAVRRLWDYLDGRLALPDAQAVDAHLAACANCPPHFDFERAFLAAVAAARSDAPDVASLRECVLAALRGGGGERAEVGGER